MSKRPAQGSGIDTVTQFGREWAWPKYNRLSEHSIDNYFNHMQYLVDATNLCNPNRKRTVIQAGGSIGAWAKMLAWQFDTVYTFEPHPDLFQCLVRNVDERNVIKLQATLGSLTGTSAMDYENFGAHSVSVTSGGKFPKMRIDDMKLDDVDLILLDIEGYEFFALSGAVETIRRCRPVIVVEEIGAGNKYLVPDAAIDKMLLGLGYTKGEKLGYDRVYVPEGLGCE